MIFFSFMIVMPLLPLYLSEIFMANKHVIGLVLSGYTITALLIRPLSGYLVDSFSRKKILLISYFLFFIFFAGYIVATSLLLFTIIRTIHGAPMGTVTVANSTVAIDVLPSTRRAEGIGYYGLSNNLATAIAPTVGLLMYQYFHSYDIVFIIALLTSGIGLYINSTVKLKERIITKLNLDNIVNKDMSYLCNLREIDLINKAHEALLSAQSNLDNGYSVDMIEIDLKSAWEYLGQIIGDSYDNELIDKIFSNFCLGK